MKAYGALGRLFLLHSMENGRHICVLDDDIFWQDILVRRFVERDIRATAVFEEHELWELLSDGSFNLVIVEPQINNEVSENILHSLSLRSIPFVVCTSVFHPTRISSFLHHAPSAIFLKGNVSSGAIVDYALRLLEKELVY